MARVQTKPANSTEQQMLNKIITAQQAQDDYEQTHSIESTIVMAFDATRNAMATLNNAAVILRNKSQLKVLESQMELHKAYAELLA